MNINLSTVRASQTKQIDLTRLPVTQVDKGSKRAGIFLMVFACLWGGIPTFVLMKAASSGIFQQGLWGLLIFGVIGIGLFLGGLYLLTTCTTTSISLETVGVTKQSLFGTDFGTFIIATGLSAPCLEWLKNCILKVITA